MIAWEFAYMQYTYTQEKQLKCMEKRAAGVCVILTTLTITITVVLPHPSHTQ